jgi:hypothetical protein
MAILKVFHGRNILDVIKRRDVMNGIVWYMDETYGDETYGT